MTDPTTARPAARSVAPQAAPEAIGSAPERRPAGPARRADAADAGARARLAAALETLHGDLDPDELILPGDAAAEPYDGDRRLRAAAGARFAVARPGTVPGVQAVLRSAHAAGAVVVPRGAGSGLSGGAVPEDGSIVLSTERLRAIREIDPLDEVAVVEAGVITADLDASLAPHGFFYAPDPASVAFSSIGGNIATNAGGLHCAKYGVIRESVLALEVVLADGTLLRTGHRSLKGVTGLDLTQLIIGSEGTLAVVVAATVRIRPRPPARRTVLARFAAVTAAARAVNAISLSPVRPAATELIGPQALRDIDAASGSRLAREEDAILLIELDGYGIEEQTADLTAALAAEAADVQHPDPDEAEVLWELRRTGRGTVTAGQWRLGEDVAVPKSRLAEMFEQVDRVGREHGVAVSTLAHAGDGNLHPALVLDTPPGADGSVLPAALHEAADDLVRSALALGGTISGEHGIGLDKRAWLDLELGADSRSLQRRIKDAFDPRGILNPGKAL